MMRIFGFPFSSKDKKDRQRLEAFLDSLPLEYCGWDPHNTPVWSQGFPDLFGLKSVGSFRDIQSTLVPSDAAALEGMIWQLQNHGDPFNLIVRTAEDGKALALNGNKGYDLDKQLVYDVLWVEDTTLRQNDLDESRDEIVSLNDQITQYQMIFDHLPQALWVTDADNNIAWCNDRYQDLAGHKDRKEIMGKQTQIKATLYSPDNETICQTDVKNLSAQAQEEGVEKHALARMIVDGKRHVFEMNALPDKMRRSQFIVNTAQDITHQENLRAELKRYVAANAELMEQLSTAIAIYSAQQKLEFYNQAFADLWGLEDQWLNTNPGLSDILDRLRAERRLPEQADFKSYKQGWLDMFTSLLNPHEDMLFQPNGNAIRTLIVPHPMGGLMMTFEDVTSRLELESSYNTLIAVQRETLDNLGEGVVVYGGDGRLKLCNPAYLRLWGLHPEDTQGQPHISQLVEKKKSFFKADKDHWDDAKKRLIAHGIDRDNMSEVVHTDTNQIYECSSVPLPDGGVMVTYRDITDSQRVKEALQEKNRALEEAEKLKTDFLANVSYQLRTPLNAISGFSEILSNEYFGDINDKQREYTNGITEAAERLSALIDDILDLSSIEAGYLRLDKEQVDIKKLMKSIYDLARDWAGMETLKIIYKKPKDDIPFIMADPRRLKQAMMNIVRNAISFTPGGGTITLTLCLEDDHILMTIKDTGMGLSDEDRAQLFKPFQSVAPAEEGRVTAPAGLGLSLAKNIIELHKGTINVLSAGDEGGTMVHVSLPL